MKKSIVASLMLITMASCDPDSLTGAETEEDLPITHPEVEQSFNRTFYSFPPGTNSPLVHPKNAKTAFLQSPELSSQGLNRVPDGLLGMTKVEDAVLSQITLDAINHSGGLIRIRTQEKSNIDVKKPNNLSNWLRHEFTLTDDTERQFGGGIGYGTTVEGDEQYVERERIRTFVTPAQVSQSFIKLETLFNGSADAQNLNEHYLESLVVEHYPLKESDFSLGPITAAVNSGETSCDLDNDLIDAQMSIENSNGIIQMNGTFSFDGEQIGSWVLSSTEDYSTDLSGEFTFNSTALKGVYSIKTKWVYTNRLAYTVDLGHCEVDLAFDPQLETVPADDAWQALVHIDFTAASNLAALPIAISEPSQQQSATISTEGWLELLPNGLEVGAEYQQVMLAKTNIVALPAGTNAVRYRYDIDASYVPKDHCSRASFHLNLISPQDEDFDDNRVIYWLDVFGETLAYERNQRLNRSKLIFIPAQIDEVQLALSLITDECTDAADGKQIRVAVDDIEIEPMQFKPSPLSGYWDLELVFYGDQCPSNSAAQLAISPSLGSIDLAFDNGFNLSGNLAANGEVLLTATDGAWSYIFTRPLTHLNKRSMWGGSIEGCTAYLRWERPDEYRL